MAARRQTKKRRPKSKKTVGGKMKSVKTLSKKSSTKKKTPAKKFRKNKAAGKKSTVRKRAGTQSTIGVRTSRTGSGRQAGDLQGLSNVERADSESVDELLEEGNAFEGEAVMGVEQADDADEKEVRTHEVPEDDVPDEYLDKE
jgi:hypothetical protein